jgi:dephospho-CoA kinase
MIILGLTGSIGMGKSTTAAMLREEGIPVYDSDAAVHELYAKGGKAVEPVGAAFPGAVRDGAIDRALLGELVLGDNAALKKLESIVHPLVRETQAAFVRKHHAAGAAAVVLDIPLLFESRADQIVDAVIVVTAPAAEQRRRLLARPGMTEEKLAQILARQVPDAQKREKADFVINTEFGLEDARNQVRAVLAVLREAA